MTWQCPDFKITYLLIIKWDLLHSQAEHKNLGRRWTGESLDNNDNDRVA